MPISVKSTKVYSTLFKLNKGCKSFSINKHIHQSNKYILCTSKSLKKLTSNIQPP